jgi:hypothetical protein
MLIVQPSRFARVPDDTDLHPANSNPPQPHRLGDQRRVGSPSEEITDDPALELVHIILEYRKIPPEALHLSRIVNSNDHPATISVHEDRYGPSGLSFHSCVTLSCVRVNPEGLLQF